MQVPESQLFGEEYNLLSKVNDFVCYARVGFSIDYSDEIFLGKIEF